MEVNELVKELAIKTKAPRSVKENIYGKLFKNLWIAIFMLLYFIFLNMGYVKLKQEVFEADLHFFAGALIVMTVAVFELAYRKDSTEIGIHGVELLVLSIINLFMPYIYYHRGILFKFVYSFAPVYIAIYYTIKCIFIYSKEVLKYKNGLSDIKEIVDEDNSETYLDEKNERKFKEVQEKEE